MLILHAALALIAGVSLVFAIDQYRRSRAHLRQMKQMYKDITGQEWKG